MRKKIILSLLVLGILFGISGTSFSQWQADVRMTNDPALSYTSFGNARCVAANGDVVHIVWYSGDSVGHSPWNIFYKRSTDKGLTWSEAITLSSTTAAGIRYNPAIAVSGSYVHVAWYDTRDGNSEEYYIYSTDGGITWSPEVRLTNNTAASGHCSIAASGLNVHLVWYDYRDGNTEIYYKQSIDGGVNWSEDLRLSNTAGKSVMPGVAVSGSVVHVAWYDSTDSDWEIYYKRSIDGGTTWGADTRLTNSTYPAINPTLAVSGSNVHLVWLDSKFTSMGYLTYKRSVDGGTSWGSDTRLSKTTFNNDYPSLAVNGSVLHLVLQRPVKTNWEIFYLTSANNGTKWGSDVQLTNNSAYSSVPSIAVSGSNVHVIFRDTRDGNYEIYYKRYISFALNPTGITNNNTGLPEVYSLNQNYPNPFNPTTTIQYQIPNDGLVILKIYDMLGKEVATLVNEVKIAGTFNVQWNASGLSSGVYFYKLTSGNFSDVKRMILIK